MEAAEFEDSPQTGPWTKWKVVYSSSRSVIQQCYFHFWPRTVEAWRCGSNSSRHRNEKDPRRPPSYCTDIGWPVERKSTELFLPQRRAFTCRGSFSILRRLGSGRMPLPGMIPKMTKAWGSGSVAQPDLLAPWTRRSRLRTWGTPQYICATYAQQPAAIFRSGAEALARIAGAHWSAGRSRVQH